MQNPDLHLKLFHIWYCAHFLPFQNLSINDTHSDSSLPIKLENAWPYEFGSELNEGIKKNADCGPVGAYRYRVRVHRFD